MESNERKEENPSSSGLPYIQEHFPYWNKLVRGLPIADFIHCDPNQTVKILWELLNDQLTAFCCDSFGYFKKKPI